MKTLFVNGCSWTYGGGLDEPGSKAHIDNLHNNIVWPAHVKKLMNFDRCINLAEGCGSNQRICCLLYTSPSPRDLSTSRMPSSA